MFFMFTAHEHKFMNREHKFTDCEHKFIACEHKKYFDLKTFSLRTKKDFLLVIKNIDSSYEDTFADRTILAPRTN